MRNDRIRRNPIKLRTLLHALQMSVGHANKQFTKIETKRITAHWVFTVAERWTVVSAPLRNIPTPLQSVYDSKQCDYTTIQKRTTCIFYSAFIATHCACATTTLFTTTNDKKQRSCVWYYNRSCYSAKRRSRSTNPETESSNGEPGFDLRKSALPKHAHLTFNYERTESNGLRTSFHDPTVFRRENWFW